MWRHNERCLTASEHPINVTTWTIDFGPDLVNRGVWAKVGSDSYGLGQSSGVILVSMQVVSSVVDLPTPNGNLGTSHLRDSVNKCQEHSSTGGGGKWP